MTDEVLQTTDLTKRFGRRTAVARVSLRVERCAIYGFLGPNGAGKSTTVRMLLGLIKPTAGTIKILGHELDREPMRARARLGACLETPAFYENFTGRQNLRLLASLSGGAQPARVEEVLGITGLSTRADEPVRVYSYGMRQRLGLAQALLPAPELVILDEPTNGLDPQGVRQVRELIRRLRDDYRLTILLSSHQLTEVEQLCDHIGIINEGRLLYQGPTAELVAPARMHKLRVNRPDEACRLLAADPHINVTRNGTQHLYVEAPENYLPDINARLLAHDIQLYELTPHRETLEDVFMRLTDAT
jgi:ABC-type multidrug transport system ATPase subunit